MFALLQKVQTEELYLTGGLSYKSLKEHEIARNGDMIDFCTTTYSSISNRVSACKWEVFDAFQQAEISVSVYLDQGLSLSMLT